MSIMQLLNTNKHMMQPVEEDGVLVAVIAPMTFGVRRALEMAGIKLGREEKVDVLQLATDLGACGWSPSEGFIVPQLQVEVTACGSTVSFAGSGQHSKVPNFRCFKDKFVNTR